MGSPENAVHSAPLNNSFDFACDFPQGESDLELYKRRYKESEKELFKLERGLELKVGSTTQTGVLLPLFLCFGGNFAQMVDIAPTKTANSAQRSP